MIYIYGHNGEKRSGRREMETVEEKVNRSIRLGNDISAKVTYWGIFGMLLVNMHQCTIVTREKRIEKNVDTILAAQEQCGKFYTGIQPGSTENDTWYLIDGKKAYVQIEGKPAEQYLMEKQNGK